MNILIIAYQDLIPRKYVVAISFHYTPITYKILFVNSFYTGVLSVPETRLLRIRALSKVTFL